MYSVFCVLCSVFCIQYSVVNVVVLHMYMSFKVSPSNGPPTSSWMGGGGYQCSKFFLPHCHPNQGNKLKSQN
jgi:hypothetical protein